MEAYAYQVLQIGEFASVVLSWVIMTASAAVAVALTNLQWRLGRGAYFLSLGFVFLLSGMTNFLALGVTDAIKNGYLAVVVGAIYGLLVPIGGLAGIFAAARSMDAYGTRDKWVSGFIPIVNLFLLFAKPKDSPKLGIIRLLGNTGMVVLGIALMGAGKGFERMVEQTIQQTTANAQNDQELQAKAMEYEVQNKGVENLLKETALAIPVPVKVDKITTLKAVQAEGSTLRYIYEISSADAQFGKAWNDVMMSRWCVSENFKPMFDIGASVAGRYVDMAGNTLAEISADPSLCATWSEALEAELTASALSVKGPVRIDEVTTLTGASYGSKTYSYHYTISVVPPDTWKDYVKTNWCKSPEMKRMMDIGLTVRGVYSSETGAPIGEVSIDKATCGAS